MSNRLRQSGFTLLETLVAFAVLALVLAVVFQVLASSSRSTRLATDYAEAVVLAQSLLAQARIDKTMASTGRQDNYQWQMSRTLADYPDIGASVDLADDLALYELTTIVSWQEAGKDRQVSLSSAVISE